MSNENKKEFKYTLKTKEGVALLETIYTFEQDLPKEWEKCVHTQMYLENFKEVFINENFDIEISEHLGFDI